MFREMSFDFPLICVLSTAIYADKANYINALEQRWKEKIKTFLFCSVITFNMAKF